jgi:mannose-1-phosphate guanylyltransferase
MFYPVIPAGGSGTRLWPLSRADHPKFLQPLTGSDASLLQVTIQRLVRLAPLHRLHVVTGARHAAAVAEQIADLPPENILVEPAPRDSCAAVGLAAMIISRRDPDAIMGVFPTDHLISDVDTFVEAVRSAIDGARSGLLMTVGITPTRPETGYGYVRSGRQIGPGPVRMVDSYTEKPSEEVARSYLAAGDYAWNAGMFIWRVDVFLTELKRQQPDLHDGLLRIKAAWGTPQQDDLLAEVWAGLPRISVDYAVMEGAAEAGQVGTVASEFGWHDIGDFDTLGRVLSTKDAENVVVGGSAKDVLFRDSNGLVVVPSSGRLVATLGVDNLIVVETDDAVLVCSRERAQDVKCLIDDLAARGDVSRL